MSDLHGVTLPQIRIHEKAREVQAPRALSAGRVGTRPGPRQFSAASVMALVQAPSGSDVITGSDPPASNVATVRS